MAMKKISTGYYTEGRRVMKKKIKKNSMWYINTTEEIQSESHNFKCVLRYSAQKIRYILTVIYLKPQTVYMHEKRQTQNKAKKWQIGHNYHSKKRVL
jgi:hypothetical protein